MIGPRLVAADFIRAVAMWRAGQDTAAIAVVLGVAEAAVANSLASYREYTRSIAA